MRHASRVTGRVWLLGRPGETKVYCGGWRCCKPSGTCSGPIKNQIVDCDVIPFGIFIGVHFSLERRMNDRVTMGGS